MSLFLLSFFLVYGSMHAYALLKARSALAFGPGTTLALLLLLGHSPVRADRHATAGPPRLRGRGKDRRARRLPLDGVSLLLHLPEPLRRPPPPAPVGDGARRDRRERGGGARGTLRVSLHRRARRRAVGVRDRRGVPHRGRPGAHRHGPAPGVRPLPADRADHRPPPRPHPPDRQGQGGRGDRRPGTPGHLRVDGGPRGRAAGRRRGAGGDPAGDPRAAREIRGPREPRILRGDRPRDRLHPEVGLHAPSGRIRDDRRRGAHRGRRRSRRRAVRPNRRDLRGRPPRGSPGRTVHGPPQAPPATGPGHGGEIRPAALGAYPPRADLSVPPPHPAGLPPPRGGPPRPGGRDPAREPGHGNVGAPDAVPRPPGDHHRGHRALRPAGPG